MAIKVLSAAGTFNLKQGAGVLRGLSCPVAGTFTLQIKDGPDSAGNTQTLYGATAGTVTTGIGLLEPLIFRDGLQIIIGGANGELDVDFV